MFKSLKNAAMGVSKDSRASRFLSKAEFPNGSICYLFDSSLSSTSISLGIYFSGDKISQNPRDMMTFLYAFINAVSRKYSYHFKKTGFTINANYSFGTVIIYFSGSRGTFLTTVYSVLDDLFDPNFPIEIDHAKQVIDQRIKRIEEMPPSKNFWSIVLESIYNVPHNNESECKKFVFPNEYHVRILAVGNINQFEVNCIFDAVNKNQSEKESNKQIITNEDLNIKGTYNFSSVLLNVLKNRKHQDPCSRDTSGKLFCKCDEDCLKSFTPAESFELEFMKYNVLSVLAKDHVFTTKNKSTIGHTFEISIISYTDVCLFYFFKEGLSTVEHLSDDLKNLIDMIRQKLESMSTEEFESIKKKVLKTFPSSISSFSQLRSVALTVFNYNLNCMNIFERYRIAMSSISKKDILECLEVDNVIKGKGNPSTTSYQKKKLENENEGFFTKLKKIIGIN